MLPSRTLADMETLFDGIPLDQVSVSMTINGPAAIIFCFFVAAAEKQGVDIAALQGTLQNDILKEYIAQHAWMFPVEPSLKTDRGLFEWTSDPYPVVEFHFHLRVPHPRGRVDGRRRNWPSHWPMASPTSSVASPGGSMSIRLRPRLSFFWDVHNDFFEEIAKLRAARRIWARHLRERYGARDERR